MNKLKILKSTIFLLMFSSPFANAENLYFGASYGVGSGQIEEEKTSVTTVDFDSQSTSIKIGYVLQDENRIEFSYETMKQDLEPGYTWYDKNEPEVSGINADAIFVMSNKTIIPFFTIGAGSYSLDDTSQYFTEGYDLGAISLNYGIGIFYNLGAIELEASYRGKYLVWEDVEYNNDITSTISMLSYLSFGLNIHF